MVPKSKQTVPVSERALLQRINRRLRDDVECVRKTRQSLLERQPDFGDYFRLDLMKNAIIDRDVDLEDLGRELKALASWESLQCEPSK